MDDYQCWCVFPLDLKRPLVKVFPSNKTREGETVVLTCTVEGYPSVKCKWTKDGVDISGSCLDLTIKNITRKDAGMYKCVAENSYRIQKSYPVYMDVYCK